MGTLGSDMKLRAKRVVRFMDKEYPTIIKVEALNHFKRSFINEGFTNKTLSKWKPRKTKDKRGSDRTRYKTNRVGRAGGLTKFGRQENGRPILTGHNSGGNKLRNSLKGKVQGNKIIIYTYKVYAKRHNEGEDMPKRQFMGPSAVLDKNIKSKIDKRLNKIFE